MAGLGEAPLPPRVQAILEQCQALPAEERELLLQALQCSAVLTAWSGSAPVPKGSAPAPRCVARVCPWPSYGREGGPGSAVAGCPWCRRPVSLELRPAFATRPAELGGPVIDGHVGLDRCAYVALLYGPECHAYFLGALVLGWGLQQHARASITRVLLHTPDVPAQYLEALAVGGWHCQRIEYLSSVAGALFHNWRKSRFIDVFTKLRALQLTSFDKVMLLDLDLLVRAPPAGSRGLDAAFELRPPAAMKRGPPAPTHGEALPYAAVWEHPTRREGDALPPHQQASGINAGVMVLRPDQAVFEQMEAEVLDWYHPEHYATYMPEQEYLSRFYGTFDQWTHLDCRFNLEIDKNERVPHDWTEAHDVFRTAAGSATHHLGAVVLHYSGTSVKPWELLFERRGEARSMAVAAAAGLPELARLRACAGPGEGVAGYADAARLWAAMLEWLEQLIEVSTALAAKGLDPIALVRRLAEREPPGAATPEA